MAKYDPLQTYLASQTGDICQLTHKRIEQIIGAELPRSARDHRPWWGNETSDRRPQARSWMDAGWKVDDGCEPQNGRVRFVRR